MNIDELTQDYMALRRERERIASEFKTEDERLKEAQSAIEAKLLAMCSEHNASATTAGPCFLRHTHRKSPNQAHGRGTLRYASLCRS